LATVVLAVAFATTLTPVNVEAEASIVSIVVGCEECGVARARARRVARGDRPPDPAPRGFIVVHDYAHDALILIPFVTHRIRAIARGFRR
jgi:hypothetical protein